MQKFVSMALATVTAFAADHEFSTKFMAGPTIWNDDMEVAAQLSYKFDLLPENDEFIRWSST